MAALFLAACAVSGERGAGSAANPPLLINRPSPPVKIKSRGGGVVRPAAPLGAGETLTGDPSRARRSISEKAAGGRADSGALAESDAVPSGENAVAAAEDGEGEQPTPSGVEDYRRRLEERLLERYNNLPEFAGRVARVVVALVRPVKASLDGGLLRAEFDQLVFDRWGDRIPALEKEYFVVTFGSGGAAEVRTDPGVRVGLDLEKTYSERSPLPSDPFRRVKKGEEFGEGNASGMPEWWRPSFRDP